MTTMITSQYNPDEIIGLVAKNFVSKSKPKYIATNLNEVAITATTNETVNNKLCFFKVFCIFFNPFVNTIMYL